MTLEEFTVREWEKIMEALVTVGYDIRWIPLTRKEKPE